MVITKENELISILKSLKQDEKVTIIGFNDFGFIQASQTKFYNYLETNENYSQKFIYMIHKPKNKRKYYKKSLDNKEIIVLKGWHNINTDKINFTEYIRDNCKIKESVFTSFENTPLKDMEIIYHKDIIYSNIK